jgi:hypothetical protein
VAGRLPGRLPQFAVKARTDHGLARALTYSLCRLQNTQNSVLADLSDKRAQGDGGPTRRSTRVERPLRARFKGPGPDLRRHTSTESVFTVFSPPRVSQLSKKYLEPNCRLEEDTKARRLLAAQPVGRKKRKRATGSPVALFLASLKDYCLFRRSATASSDTGRACKSLGRSPAGLED